MTKFKISWTRLTDLSENSQKFTLEEKKILVNDFVEFYRYTFAYLKLPEPTEAQIEMAKFVCDKTIDSKMLMALRGLAKSLTSQIYVVWRLLRDNDQHILVMSGSGRRAKNYTRFVLKVITLLPLTRHMAPRNQIERTSGESFDIQGAMISDSPSIYAAGAGNQVTGFRATLVIYDDVETSTNAKSAVMRETVKDSVDEAQNLLITGCDETIVLCTPHSMDSIYNDMMNEGYSVFIIPSEYPANDMVYGNKLAPYLREKLKANPKLAGEAVDSRFHSGILEKRKLKIGRSKYKLQYLLDTSESDDLKYPLKLKDMIVMDVNDEMPLKISYSSMPENRLFMKHNGFKQDKIFKPSYVSKEMGKLEYTAMAIDPSGRGEDETGYFVGSAMNGKVFIRKFGGLQGGYDDEALGELARIAKQYNVSDIVIESNFGDGSFAKLLVPHLIKVGINPEIHETRATTSKEGRIIETVEPMLNQHKLIFDKNSLDNDSEKSKAYSLTYQMSHLKNEKKCLEHDDIVDTLEILCSFFNEQLDVDEDFAVMQSNADDIRAVYDQLAQQHIGSIGLNYANRY